MSEELAQAPIWLIWLFVVFLFCFGMLQCFAGYRIMKLMLTLFGFALGAIAGGALGASLFLAGPLMLFVGLLVGGVVGGVIGAILFRLLYYVGVFVVGVELGVALASMLATTIGLAQAWLVMVLLGVICGILALLLQRFLIIIATAFGGAWVAIIAGLTFAYGTESLRLITNPAVPPETPNVVLGIWLAVGAVGAMVQFASTSPPEEPPATESE
jgi:hypothetical protein